MIRLKVILLSLQTNENNCHFASGRLFQLRFVETVLATCWWGCAAEVHFVWSGSACSPHVPVGSLRLLNWD